MKLNLTAVVVVEILVEVLTFEAVVAFIEVFIVVAFVVNFGRSLGLPSDESYNKPTVRI